MSAGVLAVMDRAARKLDGYDLDAMNLSIELKEARATVAELIEAAQQIEKQPAFVYFPDHVRLRLRAARAAGGQS